MSIDVRRLVLTLALAALAAVPVQTGAALAAREPTLEERVRIESEAMNGRFGPVAKRFGISAEQAMYLATMLGSMEWGQAASGVGVPATQRKALWTALNALPHPNFGDLTPYNLLTPGKDRWGVSISEGLKGWKNYGPLIEEVAIAHGLDPAILGAYVWTESNFDTRQLNASGNLCAVGLGSVQAQDYPALGGSMSERIRRLQTDPRLNLTLTAREFKSRWNPKDMFGTVMDVWYPAWRKGRRIPHLGDAFGYMQLFSNRYFLLLDMQGL